MTTTIRLVPAETAHALSYALSGEMRCRAKLKFPGDKRATQCSLHSGHVLDKTAHINANETRWWRRSGYDVEASIRPGTEGQP